MRFLQGINGREQASPLEIGQRLGHIRGFGIWFFQTVVGKSDREDLFELYLGRLKVDADNLHLLIREDMKDPVRVTVTGAAGQISYGLLFRIAAGDMLGPDQPVILQLLEIPPAMDALRGVVMELHDCAFPLLQDIVATDDPNTAFADAEFGLLVGAMPRKQGMLRKDLLEANSKIFSVQGKSPSEKYGGLKLLDRRIVKDMSGAVRRSGSSNCMWAPTFV